MQMAAMHPVAFLLTTRNNIEHEGIGTDLHSMHFNHFEEAAVTDSLAVQGRQPTTSHMRVSQCPGTRI